MFTWAMSMPGSLPRCEADSTRKSVSMDSSRVSKKSCMHSPCRHNCRANVPQHTIV